VISRSGARPFDLLGVSMLDERLVELFRELDAPVPPVKLDRTTDVLVPAHGLDMSFKPLAWLRDGASLGSPGDVLTSVLYFYGEGFEGRQRYAGELPYGLTFETPRAQAEAILDPLADRDTRHARAWNFDRHYIALRFASDDQSITLVFFGLHRSDPPHPEPPKPTPTDIATAELIGRLSAQDRLEPGAGPLAPPPGVPAELAALRREQSERETPFYADPQVVGDWAITLTDDPAGAHDGYLDAPEVGAGYARFFEDVLWIGEDEEGNLIGYWKAGADTFVGAPVIRLDNEGVCEVVAPTVVDYFAEQIDDTTGRDTPELVDFCRRAGLPLPLTEEDRFRTVRGLPDPDRVMDAVVNMESSR
jgi:hypothetical protein